MVMSSVVLDWFGAQAVHRMMAHFWQPHFECEDWWLPQRQNSWHFRARRPYCPWCTFLQKVVSKNLHQRSTHETLEAHGKIMRKTALLLKPLGSAKNEERTFKLEDGAAGGDEWQGSWQRRRNDAPETELRCLLGSSCDVPKRHGQTPRDSRESTQNKDEIPREFQRTAVPLHRRLVKALLAENILCTCDRPISARIFDEKQKSKIVSSHVVPYVACEPVVANARKCSTLEFVPPWARRNGEGIVRSLCHVVGTRSWSLFLLESRGSLVQDILNLAKERGGEWNDMISGQATDRSPDAPDAHYVAPGLADFMFLARFPKNGFRSIFGPQFGATGLGKVMSTAMRSQCHEFGARPEIVDFHPDHPYIIGDNGR